VTRSPLVTRSPRSASDPRTWPTSWSAITPITRWRSA